MIEGKKTYAESISNDLATRLAAHIVEATSQVRHQMGAGFRLERSVNVECPVYKLTSANWPPENKNVFVRH